MVPHSSFKGAAGYISGPHAYNAIIFFEGESFEHHRICKGEHDGIHPDSECQRDHCDKGEGRILGEGTESEAKNVE
jgi:hypothetical protein